MNENKPKEYNYKTAIYKKRLMTKEEIRLLVEDIFSEIPIDCETDEVADVKEEMEAIIAHHVNKQVLNSFQFCKHWKEIETKRRADVDFPYWSLHITAEPHYDDNSIYDNNMFKSGNYFNSFEDAICVIETINKLLKSRTTKAIRIGYRSVFDSTDLGIYKELQYKDDYVFDFATNIYKICQTTRPYKDAEELKQAMLEHGSYFINKKHRDCFKALPVGISDDGVMLPLYNNGIIHIKQYTYKDLFNFWLHEDGAVCGIVKGE